MTTDLNPPGDNNNPPGNPPGNPPANNTPPAHNNTPATGTSGPSAAQIASWKGELKDFYQTFVRGKSNPPDALWKLFLASKGHVSPDRLKEWVRKNDQKHYKDTEDFYKRVKSLNDSLKTLLGQDYKSMKDMPGMLTKFGLADPEKNDEAKFFGKVVKKSKSFAKQFKGFDEWWALAQHTTTEYKSSLEAAAAFVTAKATYETKYRDAMKTNIVDDAFVLAALKGNWDDTQFTLNLTSGDAWKTTMGKPRDDEFKRNWDAIFKGTQYEGQYGDLISKYRLGTMDFETFVNTDLKDSFIVNAAFPEYRAWSDKQTELGVAEDKVSITSYLAERGAAREAFGTLYKEMMGNADAATPEDLLKRAFDGNWSDALFKMTVKKEDKAYKLTDTYKNDTASFDLYWKKTLGENSVPDASLRDVYATGEYQDPIQLFDQVKNTNEFKSQFGNWDAFSAGQQSVGNAAMTDPLLYNEYKTAFQNAFADQGMQAPQDLERQFFASGETTTDFTQHVGQFTQNKEAYSWQSGEQADVATATDITADKTQGGLLRKKMQDALAQQKAYLNSNATPYRTQDTQQSGLVTQKI